MDTRKKCEKNLHVSEGKKSAKNGQDNEESDTNESTTTNRQRRS